MDDDTAKVVQIVFGVLPNLLLAVAFYFLGSVKRGIWELVEQQKKQTGLLFQLTQLLERQSGGKANVGMSQQDLAERISPPSKSTGATKPQQTRTTETKRQVQTPKKQASPATTTKRQVQTSTTTRQVPNEAFVEVHSAENQRSQTSSDAYKQIIEKAEQKAEIVKALTYIGILLGLFAIVILIGWVTANFG